MEIEDSSSEIALTKLVGEVAELQAPRITTLSSTPNPLDLSVRSWDYKDKNK